MFDMGLQNVSEASWLSNTAQSIPTESDYFLLVRFVLWTISNKPEQTFLNRCNAITNQSSAIKSCAFTNFDCKPQDFSGLAVNENIEHTLLQRVAAGDEDAFKTLYHSYRDKLYFFILRISSSTTFAEDAVQDVFLKIWQKRTELPAITSFNAYLYRMAHNHVVSGLRKMARETEILTEIRHEMQDAGHKVDDTLLFRQVQEKLQEIIKSLPRQQRLVYTMTREEGRRQDEIASELNISTSTVKNHMTEALKTIRREMARFYPLSFVAIMVLLDIRK